MKKGCLKRSVPFSFNFRLLLMFNCHNLCFILTKVAKLDFLEGTPNCLETGQK